MKKFTARFVSFIVVALMFTTLIPVAAFAADGAGVTTTAYSQFYPNTNTYNSVATNGLAQNGYGTVVLTGDVTTATDLVYTKYYTNHGHGSPKGFTWMLVEQNTNPDVATATVSQGTTIDGKPCIKVDFGEGICGGNYADCDWIYGDRAVDGKRHSSGQRHLHVCLRLSVLQCDKRPWRGELFQLRRQFFLQQRGDIFLQL